MKDDLDFYLNRLEWTFDDYIQQLKWHISLYKTASPGTGYLKPIIQELNNEIWEFFPQECTDLNGDWYAQKSCYLDFFENKE